MGFVVYEEETGRAIKYYRKESVAKSQVTKNNRGIDNSRLLRLQLGVPNYDRDRHWLYCSYAGYEGVLMGMKEPERKMWAFCRG
jgi:hypothetical protein